MKRISTISLLFVYLFSATEFRELLKLPVLVQHFSEHHALNKHISFLDFMSLHYLNVEAHGSEDARDHSLPFKTHDHCQLIASQPAWMPEAEISIRPVVIQIKKHSLPKVENSFFSFSASIWQPPKSV